MLSGKNPLREKNCSGGRDQARRGPFETSRRNLIVGGAAMERQDIRGVREYQRGKGPRLIELVSWRPEAAPLRLPPVTYEDGHFRSWFDSLPQLALSGARDARVSASNT